MFMLIALEYELGYEVPERQFNSRKINVYLVILFVKVSFVGNLVNNLSFMNRS